MRQILRDRQGNAIAPVTTSECVYRPDGRTVEESLAKRPPIKGINLVDIGDYDISDAFCGVARIDTDGTIYCCSKTYSNQEQKHTYPGAVIKIRDMKVVSVLADNINVNPGERPLVKVGDKLYMCKFINKYNKSLCRLNAEDLSPELVVKYDGICGNGSNGGLYTLGNELYLWGLDGCLYLVDKDELTLSAPLFGGLQYVLQFSPDRLIMADGTSVFEYTGGADRINEKLLPSGFEKVRQLASGQTGIQNSFGMFIYIVNTAGEVTSFYTKESGNYGGGKLKLVNSVSMIAPFRRFADKTNTNHDYNWFIETGTGLVSLSYAAQGHLNSTPQRIGMGICVNPGAYIYEDRDIYPVNGGFLM